MAYVYILIEKKNTEVSVDCDPVSNALLTFSRSSQDQHDYHFCSSKTSDHQGCSFPHPKYKSKFFYNKEILQM